jgi:hypothetical protein
VECPSHRLGRPGLLLEGLDLLPGQTRSDRQTIAQTELVRHPAEWNVIHFEKGAPETA